MKKRKIIGELLLICLFFSPSIKAQANGLSYIPNDSDEIPIEIQEYSEIIGHEFNICPELLQAIAWQESRCQEDAVNGSCKGLMQISVKWHKDRFKAAGWDPDDWDEAFKNMYVAADYLHDLFEDYEDVALVLYAYNGDQTNVEKYKKNGYLSYYVESILDKSEELERSHGK